jgi:hypothetical protein
MVRNNKLKAFVRYDGSGRVVPSSLIIQTFKPKVGNWKEINLTECCNYVPTTTTTTTIPPVYTIGETALGGKIAYILQPSDPGYNPSVQKGLVATIADVSETAEWGCFGTIITGASGTAIGTGNQNTLDIVNGCSETDFAAQLCNNLVEGGYSDWYLPSKDELNKLYLNQVTIGGFLGFVYWSSTQYDLFQSGYQVFTTGQQSNIDKFNGYSVRAIRSF